MVARGKDVNASNGKSRKRRKAGMIEGVEEEFSWIFLIRRENLTQNFERL